MDNEANRFVRDGWPTREYMRIVNRTAYRMLFTTLPGLVTVLAPFVFFGVFALIAKYKTVTEVHGLVFTGLTVLVVCPCLIWHAVTKGRRILEEEVKKVQQKNGG